MRLKRLDIVWIVDMMGVYIKGKAMKRNSKTKVGMLEAETRKGRKGCFATLYPPVFLLFFCFSYGIVEKCVYTESTRLST